MSGSDKNDSMERSRTGSDSGFRRRAPQACPAAVASYAACSPRAGSGREPRRDGASRVARRLLLWALLSAAVLPLGSCRRAVEKARRNIRIEAVEKVERRGLSGAEAVVRVVNDTGYKLVLEQAQLDIFYAGNLVTSIQLRGRVEVPRRTTGSFSTLWRLRTPDPMALYVLKKKVQQGEIAQVGVSFSVEGRGGPAPVKISQEMMPLSEFLNIFGLSLQDVKNYLEEE